MVRYFRLAGLVVGVGVISAGCAVTMTPKNAAVQVPRACWDGDPPRLFVHERCPNGVCGYTCEPNRWPQGVISR